MKRHITSAALSLLLVALAACGGSEPPTPPAPEIEGVQLTPSTYRFEALGRTFQFTARVFRDNGSTVMGAQIDFSSSDESVATISANGLASAVGPGATVITASYQGFSTTADVVVSTPDCVNGVDLAPGESQVLTIGCAIQLPAGAVGDRYRVAVLNLDLADSELTTGVQVSSGGVSASASALRALAPEPTPSRGPVFSAVASSQAAMVTALRHRTAAEHEELHRGAVDLWRQLRPDVDAMLARKQLERSGARLAAATSPARITYRENPGSGCNANPERPAFLVGENDHMAFYQDSALSASPATEITEGQVQRLLDYYEAWGATTIDEYFHGFSDIDGNGKVLAISAFNTALTGGNRAAYVNGLDLFPTEDCATSNEAELMYFNASVVRSLDSGLDFALEIPVHEAKHISSFWQGIRRSTIANAARFHPSWFEEGSAEIASEIAGRKAWASVGGPGVTERVTADWIYDTAVDESDDTPIEEFAGTYARLISAHRYLTSQPNGMIVTPFSAASGSSIYGSGWTFLRWLGDTYGGAAGAPQGDASLFTALNDSLTAPAPQGIADVVGKPFTDILVEFATGVMFHMEEVAGNDAYQLYDFVSSIEAFCYAADNPPCDGVTTAPPGSWPWPVTTLSNGTMAAPFAGGTWNGTIGNTGLRIHEFVSQGTNDIQIQVDADQPVRIIVVRLN